MPRTRLRVASDKRKDRQVVIRERCSRLVNKGYARASLRRFDLSKIEEPPAMRVDFYCIMKTPPWWRGSKWANR